MDIDLAGLKTLFFTFWRCISNLGESVEGCKLFGTVVTVFYVLVGFRVSRWIRVISHDLGIGKTGFMDVGVEIPNLLICLLPCSNSK